MSNKCFLSKRLLSCIQRLCYFVILCSAVFQYLYSSDDISKVEAKEKHGIRAASIPHPQHRPTITAPTRSSLPQQPTDNGFSFSSYRQKKSYDESSAGRRRKEMILQKYYATLNISNPCASMRQSDNVDDESGHGNGNEQRSVRHDKKSASCCKDNDGTYEVDGWMKYWYTHENHVPEPPYTPGALIHLGKTGGSSITHVMRYGCHSSQEKPCFIRNMPRKNKNKNKKQQHHDKQQNDTSTQQIKARRKQDDPPPFDAKNETLISQWTTYYHTPDFDQLSLFLSTSTATNPPCSSYSSDLKLSPYYRYYVFTLRDPLERLQSIFTFQHPRNILARYASGAGDGGQSNGRTRSSPKRPPKWVIQINRAFYRCFATLETFSKRIGDDPYHYQYPSNSTTTNHGGSILDRTVMTKEMNKTTAQSKDLNSTLANIDNSNCTNLARAMLQQQVPESDHYYWGIRRVLNDLQGQQRQQGQQQKGGYERPPRESQKKEEPQEPGAYPWIFVLRKENLWKDFVSSNQFLLEQKFKSLSQEPKRERLQTFSSLSHFTSSRFLKQFDSIHERDMRHMEALLPVNRSISQSARQRLCHGLETEYQAYFQLLLQANNLSLEQKVQTIRQSLTVHCPTFVQPALLTSRLSSSLPSLSSYPTSATMTATIQKILYTLDMNITELLF